MLKRRGYNSKLDEQLQQRKLITDTINKSIESLRMEITQELKTEIKDLQERVEVAEKERNVLKKVAVEQQNFLEMTKRNAMKGKVFVSGIPGSLTLDNEDPLDDGAAILLRILAYVQPTLTANAFKTVKVFTPKEGFDRHSRFIQFDDMKVKGDLLKNTEKLKDLGEECILLKSIHKE